MKIVKKLRLDLKMNKQEEILSDENPQTRHDPIPSINTSSFLAEQNKANFSVKQIEKL